MTIKSRASIARSRTRPANSFHAADRARSDRVSSEIHGYESETGNSIRWAIIWYIHPLPWNAEEFVRRQLFCRLLLLVAAVCAPYLAEAQSLIIPQIADGGGWQTELVATNTTTSPAQVSLTFFEQTTAGATQPWNLSFLEQVNPQNISLPAASTIYLHTPNTAATVSQGWAALQAPAGVVAYAIFTLFVPGRQNQDGTAPAAASASRILVPFDNTNGFVTSIAIANPTSQSESVTVGFQPSSGTSSQLAPIMLPAQGQMAFALPQQFAATNQQSGLLEFYSAAGSIAILALRFNPTGAFTAAPVYTESGPPIIGGGGSPSNPYAIQLAVGTLQVGTTNNEFLVEFTLNGSGQETPYPAFLSNGSNLSIGSQSTSYSQSANPYFRFDFSFFVSGQVVMSLDPNFDTFIGSATSTVTLMQGTTVVATGVQAGSIAVCDGLFYTLPSVALQPGTQYDLIVTTLGVPLSCDQGFVGTQGFGSIAVDVTSPPAN